MKGRHETLSQESDDIWHLRFSRGACPEMANIEQIIENESCGTRDKTYYAFVKQVQPSVLFPSTQLLPRKAEKSAFGIAMHELLAMFRSPKQDREATLLQFLHQHSTARLWRKELVQRLGLFLDHPEAVSLCFPTQQGEYLRVELTLFDGKGHAHRPDRVVFTGKTARIIDFKTGKHISPEDETQMRIYDRCLAEMGYTSSLHLCHIGIGSVNVINL